MSFADYKAKYMNKTTWLTYSLFIFMIQLK